VLAAAAVAARERARNLGPRPAAVVEASDVADDGLVADRADDGLVADRADDGLVPHRAVDEDEDKDEERAVAPAAGDEDAPLDESRATLIVAFVNLRRINASQKHSETHYTSVGRNVLSLASPMVLFTDDDGIAKLRQEVAPRPLETHVERLTYAELGAVQRHLERIRALVPLDPEARTFTHFSPELFALYHAKTEIVARAVRLNPFRTRKFLYVDLGSLRDWGGINVKEYVLPNKWPRPDRVPLLGADGRVLFQGVGGARPPCSSAHLVEPQGSYAPPLPESYLARPLDVPGPSHPGQWFVAGALFGGDGAALLAYDALYRSTLAAYLDQPDRDRYDLSDQHLMAALACAHPELGAVVRPPEMCERRRRRAAVVRFGAGTDALVGQAASSA